MPSNPPLTSLDGVNLTADLERAPDWNIALFEIVIDLDPEPDETVKNAWTWSGVAVGAIMIVGIGIAIYLGRCGLQLHLQRIKEKHLRLFGYRGTDTHDASDEEVKPRPGPLAPIQGGLKRQMRRLSSTKSLAGVARVQHATLVEQEMEREKTHEKIHKVLTLALSPSVSPLASSSASHSLTLIQSRRASLLRKEKVLPLQTSSPTETSTLRVFQRRVRLGASSCLSRHCAKGHGSSAHGMHIRNQKLKI